MDKKTFDSLKIGDRVLCNYGSMATVVKVGVKDVNNRKMVALKCDVKKWACPYFYRTELKSKCESMQII